MHTTLSTRSVWGGMAGVVVVCVLSGCEPAPPTPKLAPPPSSAVAPATPVGNAVQGLEADAATVAASHSGAQAGAAAPAASAATPSTASPLHALQAEVGTYPSGSNVSFLEQGVLAERLKALLGRDYATLLANLRTVSPLTAETVPATTAGAAPVATGRWYITGNRPHEGGTEVAAVLVDAAQNAVRVWMLHEGKVHEYQDPPTAQLPWPTEVQTLMGNHADAAGSRSTSG